MAWCKTMCASKSIVGAVMLLLCFAAGATAGPLDDASAAIRNRDYAVAHQILRPLADKGDALAQFNLGQLYARGWGVQRDYAEAIGWLRKPADQGLAIAQYYLALAYADGDGVPQDDAEAARWFRLAADKGYPAAQFQLGLAYADGRGVPKDMINAYMWIVLSGMRGVDGRTVSVTRNIIADEMTDDEVAAAQKRALEWKPKPQAAGLRPPLATEMAVQEAWDHYGELTDPTIWPVLAVGAVTVEFSFDYSGFCTGVLVAPNLVVTAAHCLFNGDQVVNPGQVRFLAGLNRGVPVAHSVAKRLVVSNEFSPDDWKPESAATDWAIIVLKDQLSIRPVSLKAIPREQFATVSNSGSVLQIGYGEERRYLPSIVRDCRVREGPDDGAFTYRCFTNFGYSGAPILADVDGTPSLIGIVVRGSKESLRGMAVSARQFEKTVVELMQSR
jgi:V8-like Glu-specific endopeptidase